MEVSSRLRAVWRTIVRTVHIYIDIDGEQRAASFAYYVLFSLVPLFALVLTIGSSFFSAHEITESIRSFLPLEASQQRFIWEAVHNLERARGGVSIVSIVFLIWCSLRFFQALVRGVNRAWHTVEFHWWQLPLKNLLMICIISTAMFIGLLAPAILQATRNVLLAAESFLQQHFPHFNLHLFSGALDIGRYFLGGAILFGSFLMLYKLSPNRRVYFSQVWLPALIVTISIQLCQIAFVGYLPRFVNYNPIYGTVGGLMLLLLWVYLSGIIIILGGCLCAAMAAIKEEASPTPASSED